MTTPRAEHVGAIEAFVRDARAGLPEDVFHFVLEKTHKLATHGRNRPLVIEQERINFDDGPQG